MIVTTDQDRLRRLAEFAEPFGNPEIKLGEWSTASGSGASEDPISLPYYQLNPLGISFLNMVYNSGWIDSALDWVAWAHSSEGQHFLLDKRHLGQADARVLQNVLTVIIREDRFTEGALYAAYNSGQLLAIAERAAMLAKTCVV